MAVRSRRLFGPLTVTTGSAWVTVYTCPDGRTARLSLLTVVNVSGGSVLSRVGLTAAGIDNYLWTGTLASLEPREILRGLILNPGDSIEVYQASANATVIAGFGSLLLGEPA